MDFFGYNRSASAVAPIANTESAVVSIGGKITLGQSVDVMYGQEIRPLTELGSANVYFIPGMATGTLSASKLVGSGGIFKSFKGGACGRVSSMSISVGGGTCSTGSGGNLSFSSGMIKQVSLRMQAGQNEINESVEIMVTDMQA